jgi:hypothetical protein
LGNQKRPQDNRSYRPAWSRRGNLGIGGGKKSRPRVLSRAIRVDVAAASGFPGERMLRKSFDLPSVRAVRRCWGQYANTRGSPEDWRPTLRPDKPGVAKGKEPWLSRSGFQTSLRRDQPAGGVWVNSPDLYREAVAESSPGCEAWRATLGKGAKITLNREAVTQSVTRAS